MIVSTLVWPATAVVFVLIYRKPVSNLIGRLKSLKRGDIEARFQEQLEANVAKKLKNEMEQKRL